MQALFVRGAPTRLQIQHNLHGSAAQKPSFTMAPTDSDRAANLSKGRVYVKDDQS